MISFERKQKERVIKNDVGYWLEECAVLYIEKEKSANKKNNIVFFSF